MHLISRTRRFSVASIALLSILAVPELSADPNPPYPVTPSPATVSLLPLPLTIVTAAAVDSATLTPAFFADTLASDSCVTERKTLFLPLGVLPKKMDMMICMDLTGSMGGELANAQINSANIVNQLRGLIPDSDFGVMSHMDYPRSISGCGYSATYGTAGVDYAYSLDQAVTSSVPAVTAALNALTLGNGNDGPENYTRPLFESYADAGIGWRPGAKKFVMAWLDDIPHDCAYNAILGGSATSGPDPGRNEIAGDGDDLAILSVLNSMAANNVTLIVLNSGGNLLLWKAYAQLTGGDAFQINANGTIPGGTPIAQFIADKVVEQSKHIDLMTLAACDPAYAGWVSSVSPASYPNITLDRDTTLVFDVTYCVPSGTPDSTHCFDLCALGDSAEFARQQVCITVQNNRPPDCSQAVASDPQLWPPNHKYRAISILGVTDPDSGDVVTITVIGITQDEPLNTRGDGNTCPDAQIVNGQASVRAERTGTPGIPGNGRVYAITFTASDGAASCTSTVYVCVPHDQGNGSVCIDDGQKYSSLGPCTGGSQLANEVSEVGLTIGEVTLARATVEFSLPQDAQVELAVFDVAGRRLATVESGSLVAGVHQRTWDMSGATKGLYFVRLRAGAVTLTKTVVKIH